MLDFAFYIGSTPTFLYFDLYLKYVVHYVCAEYQYFKNAINIF